MIYKKKKSVDSYCIAKFSGVQALFTRGKQNFPMYDIPEGYYIYKEWGKNDELKSVISPSYRYLTGWHVIGYVISKTPLSLGNDGLLWLNNNQKFKGWETLSEFLAG